MLSTLFIRIYALWCSFIQKTWILFGSMYFFAEILPLYFVLLLFWMSCPHGVLARQGKQGSHIDYEAAAGPHISLCQVDFLSDILMQGMCHWQSFAFPLCFTRSTTILSNLLCSPLYAYWSLHIYEVWGLSESKGGFSDKVTSNPTLQVLKYAYTLHAGFLVEAGRRPWKCSVSGKCVHCPAAAAAGEREADKKPV